MNTVTISEVHKMMFERGSNYEHVHTPLGFTVNSTGVYWCPKGYPTEQKVCSPPLVIEAATCPESDSTEWGLYLSWTDRAGRKHSWAMPGTLLAGDGLVVREELVRGGLSISSDATVRQLLLQYLSEAEPPLIIRCVNQARATTVTCETPRMTVREFEKEVETMMVERDLTYEEAYRFEFGTWDNETLQAELGANYSTVASHPALQDSQHTVSEGNQPDATADRS